MAVSEKTIQMRMCFVLSILSPVISHPLPRSSHWRCSIKKDVLKSFSKFTGKHLCLRLSQINLQPQVCNLIKKQTLVQVFFCEFCEISKKSFFHGIPLVAASVIPKIFVLENLKTIKIKQEAMNLKSLRNFIVL